MTFRTAFPLAPFTIPALLFTWACAESPNDPLVRPPAPSLATANGAIACERSWTSATDGDWWDSTRWTPAIVPDHHDMVCFAASGSYTVTGAGSARHLYLTNGAEVTLQHIPGASSTLTADSLTMQPSSRLNVTRCQKLWIDYAIVDGALLLDTDPSSCDGPSGNRPHRFYELVNNGVLELDSAVIEPAYTLDGNTDYLSFENRGLVNVRSESSIDLVEGSAWLAAGSFYGAGHLIISADQSRSTPVWWGGTRLPPRATPTSPALLLVRADYLLLTDSTTFGAMDASVHTLNGNIGSGMDVTLTGSDTELPEDVINSGTLSLLSNWVTTVSASEIFNYGAIRALSGTTFQFLRASRLLNYGVIDVTGELTLTSPTDLVNAGMITIRPSAVLTLDDADFEQQAAGSTTGSIVALGSRARVLGSGHVASLRLDSAATLSPGQTAWTGGTLSFDTLVVGSGATAELNVRDPAIWSSDRVHVNRLLSLGGTLRIATDSTYTGGVCGQVATLFSMARGAKVGGGFSSVTGAQLSASRAWRLVPGTTSHRLAGYDPGSRLSVAPRTVAVAEGGSAATADLCLGAQQPSASVSVTPTSRFGQATASPSPVNFSTTNWALPQPFTISSIDDARAEGPHIDSVSFSLTSADPGYRGMVQPQLHVDVTDNDPGVDLALSLVSAPATALLGGFADLRIRVTNAGPGNSTGSTFTLKPMAGLTLESNSAAVTCTQGSGVLTCTVGAIASGTSLDFLLLLRATATGTHTNTGRLQGRDYDPALGDNAVAWVITIS